MHAYLIVGDSEQCTAESEKLAQKLKVKVWEFPLNKIEDTRQLGKFTALKLAEPTAIIINSIDQATEEAQNAFLKNLEEPQENLYYILTAKSAALVMPTIVSRCQVIKTNNSKLITQNQNSKLDNFLKLTTGEKLALVDKIKDRGEAKDFVQDLIYYLHDILINTESREKTGKNLEISVKTLNNLEANGNVALQLANWVIHLI